jgi:hypothetical protein
MNFRVDCPFCNAATIVKERSPKAVCGRCSEAFTPAAYVETDDPAVNAAAAMVNDHGRVKRVALIALLALVLLFGGCVALMLKSFTHPVTPTPTPPALTPSTTTVKPPATLEGLQYLAKANVVFVIEPAAIAAIALRQSKSPRDLLEASGVPASVLTAIDRTGLAWEAIDHIALGVNFNINRTVPGVIAVLKLSSPMTERDMVAKLKAHRKPQAARDIYTTNVEMLLMSPVNDKTYLFGLTDEDFEVATSGFKLGLGASPDIKSALAGMISPASIAAFVTDDRDWTTASPLLKTATGKEYVKPLSRIKRVALGFAFEPDLTLTSVIEFAKESVAVSFASEVNPTLPTATVAREANVVKVTTQASADVIPKLMGLAMLMK